MTFAEYQNALRPRSAKTSATKNAGPAEASKAFLTFSCRSDGAQRGERRRIGCSRCIPEDAETNGWTTERARTLDGRVLNNPAVCPQGLLVIGLIRKPEPMPLVAQSSQVFRRVDQLPSSGRRVGVINRQKTADIGADCDCCERRKK